MIKALYYFLPALIANMVPVLVKRVELFNYPVHKKWFGTHKTVRGIFFAVLSGFSVYLLQYLLFIKDVTSSISIINYADTTLLLGLLLPLGAILGDLFESFVKRRLNIKEGKDWYPYDQFDFVLGALILSAPLYVLQGPTLFQIIIFAPLLSYILGKLAIRYMWK
jgi:CDP-2,3-bis-(O-geranylgeranyl)-sn-glycerol synthase